MQHIIRCLNSLICTFLCLPYNVKSMVLNMKFAHHRKKPLTEGCLITKWKITALPFVQNVLLLYILLLNNMCSYLEKRTHIFKWTKPSWLLQCAVVQSMLNLYLSVNLLPCVAFKITKLLLITYEIMIFPRWMIKVPFLTSLNFNLHRIVINRKVKR